MPLPPNCGHRDASLRYVGDGMRTPQTFMGMPAHICDLVFDHRARHGIGARLLLGAFGPCGKQAPSPS